MPVRLAHDTTELHDRLVVVEAGGGGGGLNPRGPYDSAASYAQHDTVAYGGSSYYAKVAVAAGGLAPGIDPNVGTMGAESASPVLPLPRTLTFNNSLIPDGGSLRFLDVASAGSLRFETTSINTNNLRVTIYDKTGVQVAIGWQAAEVVSATVQRYFVRTQFSSADGQPAATGNSTLSQVGTVTHGALSENPWAIFAIAGERGPQGPKGDPGSGTLPAHDDNFSTDRLAEYTSTFGTSKTGLLVADGVLSVTDALDHSQRHSTLSVVDAKHMLKVIPGSSTAFLFNLVAKYLDDQNHLMMQAHSAAGNLYTCYQHHANTYTNLGQIGMPSITDGPPHWIVIRQTGNHLTFETWKSNPMFGNGQPFSKLDAILTAAAIPVLGAGVSLPPGFRIHGMNGANWKLDDWVVVTASDRASF